jgi:hypothetical protein
VTVSHTSDSHHLGQIVVMCRGLINDIYANSLRMVILTAPSLCENLLTISAQIWWRHALGMAVLWRLSSLLFALSITSADCVISSADLYSQIPPIRMIRYADMTLHKDFLTLTWANLVRNKDWSLTRISLGVCHILSLYQLRNLAGKRDYRSTFAADRSKRSLARISSCKRTC